MEYIIKHKNYTEHFFIRHGSGLSVFVSDMLLPQTILYDAKNEFCVYQKDELLHIICINSKNELVYIQKKEKEYKKHILCALNSSFKIKDIKITFSVDRLNFLYSAKTDDGFILVHCILGNNAMPSVISKSADGHFFIFKNKVYYTNQNKVLGFCELAGEKPKSFHPIAENAFFPHLYDDGKNEYFVYVKDSYLYLNHKPLYPDTLAVCTVISAAASVPVLMWKSGAYLKYMSPDNSSVPKCIIGSAMPVLYSVQNNDSIYFDYAQTPDAIMGLCHITSASPSDDTNGSDIKNLLEKLKSDISDIEEKIRKLQ